MCWLKEDTYFSRANSGSFLLSYEALLRLDETVPRDVVDSVMPALTEGRSFQQASAQLPAEQQASARDLLGILQAHGLMVATATRSPEPAPLPEGHPSDLSLVITGDEALSAGLAAVLKQCGLNVGTSPAKAGANALLCHVAANDGGLCWSFADVRSKTPTALPRTAFRRAASY